MRILVVEDEALIALEITMILEQMGHEVVGVAADRAEALEMARDCPPDLALVDLHLADGRTGAEVARGVRREHNAGVLLVTSHSDLARELSDAAEGSFTKPFTSGELRRAVSAVTAQMNRAPLPQPLPAGLRLFAPPV
jgi:DNA-binding response OmpR family regulator